VFIHRHIEIDTYQNPFVMQVKIPKSFHNEDLR
jgi:hypothetical protein